MSTNEDFENAPVGATATYGRVGRAMKLGDGEQRWILKNGRYVDDREMEFWGYTLDPLPSQPTSAREALELAWELAHPVKEGQELPAWAPYIRQIETSFFAGVFGCTDKASSWDAVNIRTLEPLPEPEPEPDWLEAPAVIAWSRWDDVRREKIWSEDDGRYKSTDGEITNWQNLRDVTPLYPKGQDA